MERRGAIALLLVVCSALWIGGCSGPERDRWLAVFFDDPPTPEQAVDTSAAIGDTLIATRAAAAKAGTAHAPYEAGACEVCHDLGGSMSFPGGGGWPGRRPDATRAAQSRSPESSAAARLRLPGDRICGGCHDDLDAEKLAETNRVVHAPVAMGQCAFCHDPHRSAYAHLLKQADSSKLCIFCHDEDEAERRCDHLDVASRHCVDCHEPHAGSRTSLLREETP